MKPQRSYSDPEIARYVLGLDMAEQAQDIQALLAHDNAAAARALKWEAYLLGIVDALPSSTPPDTLLPEIQHTLGMTFEESEQRAAVLGEVRTRPAARSSRSTQHPWAAWLRQALMAKGLKRPSRKTLVWGCAAGAAIVVLIVIVAWANLRTTPKTVVHQVVPLQIH